MKFLSLAILIFSCLNSYCQTKFNGLWQGVLIRDGYKESESMIFYVNIQADASGLVGKTREESYNTDLYAIQKIKGNIKGKQIEFKQIVIESKKSSSKFTWCSADFKGEYIDSSAYISGTYNSTTCKRNSGKFILYRSKATFSENEVPSLGHAWRDVFLDDLKYKRKAPEIRELERQNFKFEPVYFDHDKAEIKAEYYDYLREMIRVVNGHSDLRIQITGNTDADGTTTYNEDLSRRRAKAIEHFFKDNGLEIKKLVIDFKGETNPIDNNDTPEGKQRNRRVDFKFI